MIETTTNLPPAFQTAVLVHEQISHNWPAICAAALWLRTEVKNVAEYVISHGGLGMIGKKLLWNPAPKI